MYFFSVVERCVFEVFGWMEELRRDPWWPDCNRT